MFRVTALLLIFCTAAFAQTTRPAVYGLGLGNQPRIALGPGDKAYTVFGRDSGVYFTWSNDGGESWACEARVKTLSGKMPLGMRRGPRICIAGDAVIITEIIDGNLIAVRSTDQGRMWSKPIAISDVRAAAREGLQGRASDGRDRIVAVWLDDRDEGKTVMSAVSSDRGKSWSGNVLAYRSPDGHVCECCHPSVTFDSSGDIHVMFRNWVSRSRDMYLVSSHDSGKSWSAARKLGTGAWLINACPMDGGEIASFGGTLITAWQRDGIVMHTPANSFDQELSAGSGRQPSIAAAATGAWLAYLHGNDLTIVPESASPFVLAHDAAAPVIAGCGTRLMCTWESNNRSFIAVLK